MAEVNVFELYVIYEKPKDYPFQYVARKHAVLKGGQMAVGEVFGVSKNVEHLRTSLRDMGLICVPRFENDDPCIIETWF